MLFWTDSFTNAISVSDGATENIVRIPTQVPATELRQITPGVVFGSDGTRHFLTDGTVAGTRAVDGYIDDSVSAGEKTFVILGDHDRRELWVGNHRLTNLRRLRSFAAGEHLVPQQLVAYKDRVLFAAANQRGDGREIWTSNGTSEGTVRITQITDLPMGADPTGLVVYQDQLIFSANDQVHGDEVWSLDLQLPGDVNNDLLVDARDIDRLFAAIQRRESGVNFDIDMNGSTDSNDIEALVQDVLSTMTGDLNLDKRVDPHDFLTLAKNFGLANLGWADGDLDGDGVVDFADFLLLAAHVNP